MRSIKQDKWSTGFETDEERHKAGRWNPAMVLHFRDKIGRHRVTLTSGTKDYLYLFREKDLTFILAINHGLGYVAMQAFKGSEELKDVYLDDSQWRQAGYKNWEGKSPIHLCKLLANWYNLD